MMSAKNPKNLYKTSLEFGVKKLDTGFDYHKKDIMLKNTMMPRLFENENVAGFLSYINDVMVNNVDSVYVINNFFNYTVDKNDLNTK